MGIAEQSYSKEMTIKNSLGLHARPASQLVKLASTFEADIFCEKDGEKINAKSLMGLLMLSANCGSSLKFTATGDDSKDALEAIAALIDRKFDEE